MPSQDENQALAELIGQATGSSPTGPLLNDMLVGGSQALSGVSQLLRNRADQGGSHRLSQLATSAGETGRAWYLQLSLMSVGSTRQGLGHSVAPTNATIARDCLRVLNDACLPSQVW